MNRAGLMAAAMLIALAATNGIEAQTSTAARAGDGLRKGMRLIYGSEGTEQTPWVVDSLDLQTSWLAGGQCSYIRFGTRDVRRLCMRGDTLFNWDEAQAKLVATRPLAPRSSLRITTANGGSALYETGELIQAKVGARSFNALPTIVTTFDTAGTPVRRLREQYVLSLATALGGVFEVPDPARPGQWQVQRQFALVRIE